LSKGPATPPSILSNVVCHGSLSHYWDVAHGKVVKTDKVVCSAPVLPPITSATNMTKAFSLVQITGGLAGLGKTLSIFGKDVEMLRVLDEKSYTEKHSLGILLKRYNRFNHLKNLRFLGVTRWKRNYLPS